ncbi:LacI family transcriptional regulator [Microbacterium sp. 4R-513]|uniref:LacI family DNA-binding transcriptional regulator n=1 Tax=Microbacterium sp. 4R-513 TaxID=2567934 RepID=UPI0013E14982|nr:LacI family DNA-binding transcriptional regulator [Microbacterium sp. 4R-513]QIG39839.1 LacI family transcriptional regulator [Microbacterium sp. 4R-513]
MAGIADVARAAGVSKATASRALTGSGYVSEATRERVLGIAASLGYVASTAAVSLATGRSQNIGVVMPYVSRWFFAEVLEGIQDSLLRHGYDLTLYDARPGTEGRRRVFEDFLARKRFDGLIAVGLEPSDNELERLVAIGCPLVSVVGQNGRTSVVALDDEHAARRATEHLVELGHTSIAFLGGGGPHWAHVDHVRMLGYEATMTDAGLRPSHIMSAVTMPGGYAAAVDLLGDSRRRPTAIVGACDEVAIGAIIAARRLGLPVPSALSVVGIDNHEYAEMFSLTTLEQSPHAQGSQAAELLLRRLREPGAPIEHVRLQATLIVRNSTAPPQGVPSVAVGAGAAPSA